MVPTTKLLPAPLTAVDADDADEFGTIICMNDAPWAPILVRIAPNLGRRLLILSADVPLVSLLEPAVQSNKLEHGKAEGKWKKIEKNPLERVQKQASKMKRRI
ncbi:unnamed protein product [Caenorhabditis auriculariae]|uniref:Uncharacterized protein n=1 Tax=Caenorhabditis auriculariae TaxID=2777116 RepID=A0A8S1H9X3_9PELO|nr:unnamed protein product [Caenorhabditis auriculariae]